MGNIRFNTTTTTTGIFCIYRCRRFLLLLLLLGSVSAGPGEAGEVYLLTAAPRDTDAFQRFLRSARHFNYTVKALGVESEASGPLGGGLALPLVKEALQGDLRHLGDDSVVVVMSRDHDVLLASGPAELLAKFRQARHRLVFAAESFAWPDQGQQGQGLRDHYPAVRHGKRFLSHGGLVGTGAAVRALLALWDGAGDTATDERDFYTRVYLDPELREQLNITLDHRCRIFQNLHGSLAEVVLKFETGRVRARNIEYNSLPVVVFGSGQTKAHLTYLGNYIPDAWSYESGCRACLEEERDLAAGTEVQTCGEFCAEPTWRGDPARIGAERVKRMQDPLSSEPLRGPWVTLSFFCFDLKAQHGFGGSARHGKQPRWTERTPGCRVGARSPAWMCQWEKYHNLQQQKEVIQIKLQAIYESHLDIYITSFAGHAKS
ncbi:procollagen-lysine,2-oxoglutarate 5-dioxygenase 1-like [Petromyzon marinus]|uniref:procollagen-lysine,2-oxoglutarate 5-dioxygenase 1-like n=1 Tax=Petromyzon marinus TaxID=7757 RepID=UPI003F70A677